MQKEKPLSPFLEEPSVIIDPTLLDPSLPLPDPNFSPPDSSEGNSSLAEWLAEHRRRRESTTFVTNPRSMLRRNLLALALGLAVVGVAFAAVSWHNRRLGKFPLQAA